MDSFVWVRYVDVECFFVVVGSELEGRFVGSICSLVLHFGQSIYMG